MNSRHAVAPTPSSASCATCAARCCRLEVILMGDDDPPAELTVQDAWGGWVMRRLDDGGCAALDRRTLLCSIYARRPQLCRDYPEGEGDCLVEYVRRPGFDGPQRIGPAS